MSEAIFKLIVIKRNGGFSLSVFFTEEKANSFFDAAYTDTNTLFPALFKATDDGNWTPHTYDLRYQIPEPGQWDKFQDQAGETVPIQRTTLDSPFG